MGRVRKGLSHAPQGPEIIETPFYLSKGANDARTKRLAENIILCLRKYQESEWQNPGRRRKLPEFGDPSVTEAMGGVEQLEKELGIA